ncbi:MAG: sulfite exporter TauE/SafE family protein [Deltaproteobacteria bacterium]|nr:sulfite exporter TauE/SafE family protein [Deltaproteobacteria bacterium]
MGESWLPLLGVAAAGVVAGFVNMFAGGGSMLTLPALMLLGLPPGVANGTNRLGMLVLTASGAHAYHQRGALSLREVVPIAAPTVVGALLGAWLATSIPSEWLGGVLLGTMLSVALLLLLRPAIFSAARESQALSLRERPSAIVALFAAGLYAGFVQAGVGFLMLAILGGLLRYDMLRANALKLAVALFFVAASLGVFIWSGDVRWLPGLVLAAGSVLGARLGVRFASKVEPGRFRWLLFVAVLAGCVAAWLRL